MRATVELLTEMLRSHQWSPLELLALAGAALTLGWAAIDAVALLWRRLDGPRRRRAIRRAITGGRNGYVDPAHTPHLVARPPAPRVPGGVDGCRHTVGRPAAAAGRGPARLADTGAARHPDRRDVGLAAGVSADAGTGPRESERALASRLVGVFGRTQGGGLDRIAGYGETTTLVFPRIEDRSATLDAIDLDPAALGADSLASPSRRVANRVDAARVDPWLTNRTEA